MSKLLILLVAAAAIQSVISELRDQRHVQMKLDTVNEYLEKSETAIDHLKNKETEVQNAANDFCKGIKQTVKYLVVAFKDNTRNNQHGKHVYEVLHQAKQFEEWVETKHGDIENVQANLKEAVQKYSKLVKDVSEVFPYLKDSTENVELASNSVIDAIDNSLFLIKKLFNHLEFKNYANNELHEKINVILEHDYILLQQITPGNYRLNELEIHAHQLSYFVSQIIDRLQYWVEYGGSKYVDLIVIVEKIIVGLHKIQEEIQHHVHTKPILEELKIMYKLQLGQIATTVDILDVHPIGESRKLAKSVLFDILGIASFYETIFANLAGSSN